MCKLFGVNVFYAFSLCVCGCVKMLIEQKKLKRQSQMLIQSVSPAEALQKALAEISTLTRTLEKERLEHQKQVTHTFFRKEKP